MRTASHKGENMSNMAKVKTHGAIKMEPNPKTAPPTAPAAVAYATSVPPRSTCRWRRTAAPMVPERVQRTRYVNN